MEYISPLVQVLRYIGGVIAVLPMSSCYSQSLVQYRSQSLSDILTFPAPQIFVNSLFSSKNIFFLLVPSRFRSISLGKIVLHPKMIDGTVSSHIIQQGFSSIVNGYTGMYSCFIAFDFLLIPSQKIHQILPIHPQPSLYKRKAITDWLIIFSFMMEKKKQSIDRNVFFIPIFMI